MAAVLHFETYVDGQRWGASSSATAATPPGESWVGRAEDLLCRTCSSTEPGFSEGLTPGLHSVELRATLPGSDVMLTSASATVMLERPGDGGLGDDDEPDADNDDGGCNASGTPSLAGLLGLGLVAFQRRRRRR